MSLISRMRKQKAVYWGNPQNDGYGSISFDEPVEIACRWTDRNEIVVDDFGEQIVSKSTVYVPSVLDEGGYLKLGELDSSIVDNPLNQEGAFKILITSNMPNIRATEYLIKAFL